jgi:protein-S-isoprenylcysteine O-methyltransferase Ste14
MSLVMPIATFGGTVALAWLVFRAVARDYQTKRRLTPRTTFFETTIFFAHGCVSYVYLDSDLSVIRPGSLSFTLAVTLIVLGLAAVYSSMSRLGWSVSTGQEAQTLCRTGPYRLSRNPQIVAYFFIVAGYSLLWPSLLGGIWVCLYLVIAHIMVRTEEPHLARLFGDEYREYCARTPRYVGRPKQS